MEHQHNQGTDHMPCLAEVSLATADATFATISGPVRHTSPRRCLSAMSMRLLFEKLVLDKRLTEPAVRAQRSCEARRSSPPEMKMRAPRRCSVSRARAAESQPEGLPATARQTSRGPAIGAVRRGTSSQTARLHALNAGYSGAAA